MEIRQINAGCLRHAIDSLDKLAQLKRAMDAGIYDFRVANGDDEILRLALFDEPEIKPGNVHYSIPCDTLYLGKEMHEVVKTKLQEQYDFIRNKLVYMGVEPYSIEVYVDEKLYGERNDDE
jgi:hypothetical protein